MLIIIYDKPFFKHIIYKIKSKYICLNYKKTIMTKKIFTYIFSILALAACTNSQKTNNEKSTTQTTEKIETIQLADFNSQAANFVNKKVELSGIVDHVCKHGGKKILLVNAEGTARVHIESANRFKDSLTGNNVSVIGIVKEFVVDEAYCQSLEEKEIKNHSEGQDNEQLKAANKKQAQFYRDSMKNAGLNHLSFYSLDFVSFK